jgi:hypothetical protein
VAELFALGAEPQRGASFEVCLEDGTCGRAIYQVRDVAAPPAELLLPRPAGVPPLALGPDRSPDFVYFRLTAGTDGQGRPLYRQVTE